MLPVVVPLALWPLAVSGLHLSASGWLALGNVGTFSAFLGLMVWYRALALGGIARVGQLQLLQPVFGLIWAVALLGGPISVPMIAAKRVTLYERSGLRPRGTHSEAEYSQGSVAL